MSMNASDYDAPSCEYIADSWGWKQDGATWMASLRFASGGDAVTGNRWVAATVAGLLEDFSLLARMRTAMLLADEGPTRFTRDADEPYALFRARLLNAIPAHPLPLIKVSLGLDVHVWVRATDSRDRPRLAWISYPGIELGLHLDDEAWVNFSLDTTLFSAFTYPDKRPNPLYPLNQPLLESVLRRLRARAGEPLDRSGELPGTHEFGFSPDPDDY
jgi:hypothetical protein